ncbi:DUF2155 domain-containing protein [Emcibacter nanhaiensis]|uniref:DUF2155 domain-containing protein n=1 Tax=Emcibacter nanhaiensis TaxID=1505037 RepID=A0A501PRE9_9PROT|nr:DUF2155 domain-containing protein [Emcibacter nanhaiensis]TPD63099.1 DUF2155 domain-containing protein [Emcibacter nanhaiensis]
MRKLLLLSVLLQSIWTSAVWADEISDNSEDGKVAVVVLGALDKITARLSTIEARQDEPVRFGTLEIVMRHCRSNPPEETPESVAFLEITDVGQGKERNKVFSGWMFASSPAVSPLEHPVYDIWVTSCKMVSGAASAGNE